MEILFWYLVMGFALMTFVMFQITYNKYDKENPKELAGYQSQQAILSLSALKTFSVMLLLILLWPYIIIKIGLSKGS